MTVISANVEYREHVRMQWAVTILSNTLLLTYALQAGWISPMAKVLQSEKSPTGRPLTDSEISWIASTPSLSAVVSVLIFLQIVDRYGRKICILVITVFQALAWFVSMIPPSTASLIIARIFCGVAGGGCFHVVPMYIKEIAQDNIRGTLGSVMVIAQGVGFLLMYTLGGFLDYYTVLFIVVGLPILTFGLFLKAPESPIYLVKYGKTDEAAAALAFLRSLDTEDKEIQNEIDMMKKDDEYYKSLPNISIVTVLRTMAWRRAFIIMILVILVHATNGAFSLLNYTATLLADSKVNIRPELQSLSIPVCMMMGSCITTATIDRLGRKPILVTAFSSSAIAFLCIATSIMLQKNGWSIPGWLNVTMMMVAICSYGGGISSVPFIVMPEIFNFQIRAKLMGYLVMTAWFMSFVQLIIFGSLTSKYGAHVPFFIFVIINILGAIITLVLLPETKNKTVEQIEWELTGGKTQDAQSRN